jgi:thioredoxin 1
MASVAKVNIDECTEVAWTMGIQSVPTLAVFRNGKEVQRFVGLQSEEVLSEALNRFLP